MDYDIPSFNPLLTGCLMRVWPAVVVLHPLYQIRWRVLVISENMTYHISLTTELAKEEHVTLTHAPTR